jgi:hypothetical protein
MSCSNAQKTTLSAGITNGVEVRSDDCRVPLGKVIQCQQRSFYMLAGDNPQKIVWVPMTQVMSGPTPDQPFVVLAMSWSEFIERMYDPSPALS